LHLLTPETKETSANAVSDIRKLPITLGLTKVNLRQRGEAPFRLGFSL